VNENDLAWLAGLLEGEGSFLKGPPSSPHLPVIQLHMIDEDVVDRVAKLFGRASYYREDKRRVTRGWRPAYQVQVKGRKAVELMKMLRPLMGRRRREQIDTALASYKFTRYQSLPPEVIEEVKRRVAEGSNKTQLAKELDISRTSVYRALEV
jgi:transcriptional regulator with PAS, ATPase and Fis domain